MEWIISLSGAAAIVVAAGLAYWGTRERSGDDRASRLFNQANELKDDYRDSYLEMKSEFETLTAEVRGLRKEVTYLIREGEQWRGVAVLAFHGHVDSHGSPPPWWPLNEPHPERIG
ncbi:MAG: hypothetical protein M3094_09855 [Actinomycetia bacterium]|nr:hypothetical protein [Actinomycetes bacterium]